MNARGFLSFLRRRVTLITVGKCAGTLRSRWGASSSIQTTSSALFPFVSSLSLAHFLPLRRTFPSRHKLTHDATTRTTRINLHAPCGLVRVDVPTLLSPSNRITYDPTRLVSFLSVPCFATALDLEVEVDEPYRWPELGERRQVKVDVAFGGAFCASARSTPLHAVLTRYGSDAILSAKELGFSSGLRGVSLSSLSHATARLKALLVARYPSVTHHPTEPSLSYLYGVVVSDTELADDETGLCFFADQLRAGVPRRSRFFGGTPQTLTVLNDRLLSCTDNSTAPRPAQPSAPASPSRTPALRSHSTPQSASTRSCRSRPASPTETPLSARRSKKSTSTAAKGARAEASWSRRAGGRSVRFPFSLLPSPLANSVSPSGTRAHELAAQTQTRRCLSQKPTMPSRELALSSTFPALDAR